MEADPAKNSHSKPMFKENKTFSLLLLAAGVAIATGYRASNHLSKSKFFKQAFPGGICFQ
ncbi:MAG: hypothetical protein QGF03_06500 [SAR324 cluster bacterium]|nr:hypothetical protein [SAR324 cluster bacterium]